MHESTLPSAEEIFDQPRPSRPPHPDMPEGDPSPAMEVADRECVRLLINTCFFNPPIADKDIQGYANRYKLTFSEAESQLREIRL
jgi:hypothetical protein